ncbi:hypothetical protein FAZ19_16265 [Sphingobacterium alkalisoli]|uniref:Uncharacterized protein n=1 Tax=Sphingobacterium alkalisoli TaxID=1874115 RepID=A0A4U0GXB3_9SPHI|nr:hypothetical protein [Sphingobacterium alkalisoli]TJY63821.1 hypothetical protein FAZ19_16265 [Sphingobacterium alkalisoli]GGH24659.1 hypothetical protein GCM10011418_32730 [Sphingobacterium alkalisoli]
MQELRDLIEKLTKLRDELPAEAERIAGAMASNHKAYIVSRIQAEGIPGKQYSDKGVPAYFYSNDNYSNAYARLDGAGFDRMIKQKKKKKELVSWKDVREANGRQTNHVDFTFSGRTFQNLNVVSIETSGFVAKAYLGAPEPELANRLSYGFQMYGDFLSPNEEEKKLLNTVAKEMTDKLFEKYKI